MLAGLDVVALQLFDKRRNFLENLVSLFARATLEVIIEFRTGARSEYVVGALPFPQDTIFLFRGRHDIIDNYE